ncbi:sulfurtransferase complex subunit TusC [Marinobacterium weihaiense]|uniref:Sulfurtransferase complex subunit TusC n=1 Tax=Marinobacterium weihaiense TaxID=2851016 RepID=A0ABS6M6C4_9GAMM|nr:sulfurtransferase complex subunit TusC [Marinobacterium weihaiense]MBV0931822.1 sulfurtransferase complex subunit TusC [Marinobacterium weihaiense]
MSQKPVLIISRSAPFASSSARDAIDIALSAAIFDLPVSLLLLDDAVLQLLPGQDGTPISEKTSHAMLGALPMYDIETLYTSEDSLALHGLSAAELLPEPEVLNTQQLQQLISHHPVVLTL